MNPGPKSSTPASVDELIEVMRSEAKIIPRGAGTKPSLWSSNQSTTEINTHLLSGVVEYLPSEYTITVKAGTRLTDVIEALAENGQYLPFDPPLAKAGATIGGTIAAGLSGPGAYRYGPLKDFIIGVRFIDGQGNHVRGGGKVVKNAAGFDFPKLFNGSLGRMGILTEVSFKVFPEPKRYATLETQYDRHEEILQVLPKLRGYDLEGVEIDSHLHLLLRLGYQEATMDARKAGLETLIGRSLTLLLGEQESNRWNSIKAFDWSLEGESLFKTVTHLESAARILSSLDRSFWKMHVSNGGKTLYLSCADEGARAQLEHKLHQHGLTALQLRGDDEPYPLLGKHARSSFVERVQKALDPDGKFLSYSPARAEVPI